MKTITHYSFGSIEVDGHTYRNDIIIYPQAIQPDWWRKEGHRLQLEDIEGVLSDPPEVLVVGQGDSGMMVVDARVAETLENLNVQLVAAHTKAACESFNKLSQEGKRVVAALHLTC